MSAPAWPLAVHPPRRPAEPGRHAATEPRLPGRHRRPIVADAVPARARHLEPNIEHPRALTAPPHLHVRRTRLLPDGMARRENGTLWIGVRPWAPDSHGVGAALYARLTARQATR